MLTWDDDATPTALQPRLQQVTDLPRHAAAGIAALKTEDVPLVAPTKSAQQATNADTRQRRVNAGSRSVTVQIVFQHDNRISGTGFQFG